jgi:hypothetical protein
MKKPKNLFTWVAIFSPVLICVLLMLPRLASAQFGLLDDGNTIKVSQTILSGHWNPGWENNRGRFRPTYWLYYALVYWLVGNNPQGFYITHLLLFAAATAVLIYLVWTITKNPLQAWLTGIVFVLSGPIIENFYTLSKGEPIQVFCFALGTLWIVLFNRTNDIWKKGLYFLGAAMLVIIAWLAKETTLVLLPISVGTLVIGWGSRRFRLEKVAILPRLAAVFAVCLAGLSFFILRNHYIQVGITEMGYSSQYSFQLKTMLASAVRWAGWLVHDFPYLAPLLLWAIGVFILNRRIDRLSWYLDAIVWMVGWVIIFIPWVFTQDYYLFPFVIGSAILSGLAASQAIQYLRGHGVGITIFSAICLLASLLLFGITLTNNATTARMQLTVDSANQEVVEYLAKNTPSGGQVLVNLSANSEYIPEMGFHFDKLYNRADINLAQFTIEKPVTSQPLLIVSPDIKNQPLLTVRIGFYEDGSAERNQLLINSLAQVGIPVHIVERKFTMFNIDLPRLLCPFVKVHRYCSVPAPVVDQRELSYRWFVYAYPGGQAALASSATLSEK